MGLSDYDKKVLEQLERDLIGADDSFARKLAGSKVKRTNSAAKVIAGALVGLIGMSLLVFGAISHLTIFGVAGFAVALVGILVASANPVSQRSRAVPQKDKVAKGKSFFENRWDQRRDQG